MTTTTTTIVTAVDADAAVAAAAAADNPTCHNPLQMGAATYCTQGDPFSGYLPAFVIL